MLPDLDKRIINAWSRLAAKGEESTNIAVVIAVAHEMPNVPPSKVHERLQALRNMGQLP